MCLDLLQTHDANYYQYAHNPLFQLTEDLLNRTELNVTGINMLQENDNPIYTGWYHNF